jgi:hypothetical protein
MSYDIAQKSTAGDAVLITSYTDDYIVKGKAFEVKRTVSISAGSTLKLAFDHTALHSINDVVFVLPLLFLATGGPVEIKTYRITSYTGGTIIPANQLNKTAIYTALGLLKTGITSAGAPGDDLREYLLGGEGNPQQVNRAGASNGAAPVVINGGPNAKLCIEIINGYTNTIKFNLGILWYELIGSGA